MQKQIKQIERRQRRNLLQALFASEKKETARKKQEASGVGLRIGDGTMAEEDAPVPLSGCADELQPPKSSSRSPSPKRRRLRDDHSVAPLDGLPTPDPVLSADQLRVMAENRERALAKKRLGGVKGCADVNRARYGRSSWRSQPWAVRRRYIELK